jgi:hypothetical protein
VTQPRRDWGLARSKRDAEGARCRLCKSSCQVELAHVWRRQADRYWADGTPQGALWIVLPERVVPLCREHHRAYDAHLIDLLGHLTPQEEAQAVIDADGLENARIRICPSEYRARVAA